MKRYVLDASAVLAFFQDEPGAEKVQELLTRAGQAERPLLMSVVNWGEVIYVVWQRRGEEAARERMRAMARYPLEIVAADPETTLLAATLKAQHKLSYVDCFAAAVALAKKATLVTTDQDFAGVRDELDVVLI